MEGLERILAHANVVIIELALLYLDEPVPRVEAIRVTAAQRTDTHLKTRRIGLGEHLRKHGRTNTLVLIERVDVQVIEQQALTVWFDHDEANALAVEFDMASVFGAEGGKEALSRTHRIKTANPLQALPHGFDPEFGQCVAIGGTRRTKRDREWCWHADAL